MIEAALAFVFGLLIGSFLNVCIYRLPRDLSVVTPRSFCPACEHPIAWYDNVPLVSYVRLRAKCRHCGARIGWRYPLVELLTGALFFVLVYAMGPTLLAAKFCLLAALLVGMIFSDIEERILPDEFTLGGAAAGIALAWFVLIERGPVSFFLSLAGYEWSPQAYSLAESVAGVLVPSIFLWFCGFVFEKVRHKEGLGLGDVKMIATVGAFLGLQGALQTLILGSIMGTVIGLVFILVTRKEMGSYQLPFGSFLGMAALILVFLGLRTN